MSSQLNVAAMLGANKTLHPNFFVAENKSQPSETCSGEVAGFFNAATQPCFPVTSRSGSPQKRALSSSFAKDVPYISCCLSDLKRNLLPAEAKCSVVISVYELKKKV